MIDHRLGRISHTTKLVEPTAPAAVLQIVLFGVVEAALVKKVRLKRQKNIDNQFERNLEKRKFNFSECAWWNRVEPSCSLVTYRQALVRTEQKPIEACESGQVT